MLRVGVMVASSDVQQVCVQDDSGFLFQNDVPSVDDSDEAILASFCASGVTEKPVEGAKGSFKKLIY